MQIDPKSHIPIFRQIAQQLREKIAAGVFRTGDVMPSQRTLALEIHVNPNTIQRAYEEMEREGIVFARRGVGMIVADRESLKAQGSDEKRVAKALGEVVTTALDAGIPPARIRSIFDDTIHRSMSKRKVGS